MSTKKYVLVPVEVECDDNGSVVKVVPPSIETVNETIECYGDDVSFPSEEVAKDVLDDMFGFTM